MNLCEELAGQGLSKQFTSLKLKNLPIKPLLTTKRGLQSKRSASIASVSNPKPLTWDPSFKSQGRDAACLKGFYQLTPRLRHDPMALGLKLLVNHRESPCKDIEITLWKSLRVKIKTLISPYQNSLFLNTMSKNHSLLLKKGAT